MNDAKLGKLPRKAPTAKAADRDTIPSGASPLPPIPTKKPGYKPKPNSPNPKPSRPYLPSKKFLSQQNTI